MREVLAKPARGIAFESVHDLVGCDIWRGVDEQMDVIGHDLKCKNVQPQFLGFFLKESPQRMRDITLKDPSSAPGDPDEVVVQKENRGISMFIFLCHRHYYGIIV